LNNFKSGIAIALISATSAVVGSYFTGAMLLESNKQQIDAQKALYKLDLKKVYIENLVNLSSDYNSALSGLIDTGLTDSNNEKKLISNISSLQIKGMELILITDDEIAQIVNSVNYYAALYLKSRNTGDSKEVLNKLVIINTKLIKSLRTLIQANYEFQLNSKNKWAKTK